MAKNAERVDVVGDRAGDAVDVSMPLINAMQTVLSLKSCRTLELVTGRGR